MSIWDITEKDPRHEPRVNTMVTAPAFPVVLENRPRHHTGGTIPRHAVACVESQQQIGGVFQVGSVVELGSVENFPDADYVSLFVHQTIELGDKLFFQSLRFSTGRYNALRTSRPLIFR